MKASLVMFRRVSLALALLAAVSAFGQNDPAGSLAAGIPVEGRTVIMGTWHWDIESNSQGKVPGSDLWWQQVDGVQQFLVPLGGSGIALLETKDFDSIGVEDLKKVNYGRCPMENVSFGPESILGVKTVEGNYAKIRVVGFREMHDISFADAQYGRPSWFAYLSTKPNKLNYHLEVDWMIFPRERPARL